MPTASTQYRYDTVKEFQRSLMSTSEQYRATIKKYQRRITEIDVTVQSVSGIMAGAGIILSSVTMTAPVVVPICIYALTTIITATTKKLSSCSTRKLYDATVKYHTISTAYAQLPMMISSSIDDEFISDDEFTAKVQLYHSTMERVNHFNVRVNNNNNNVEDIVGDITHRTTSTDSGEYHPGKTALISMVTKTPEFSVECSSRYQLLRLR